jgi:peptide/nickel transport system substrate-binding protein
MISRKTFLTRLAALGVAGALAAACGGAESGSGSSSAAPTSKAPTDKVLRLSFLEDIGQPPDPAVFYAGQGLMLTTNTYEGLLRYEGGTDTPKIIPSLATKWSKSADNKTFTLELRQGVTFHDGTPFTSAAVKASFDRTAAVDQGPAYMVSEIKSVTTNGDYKVTITLKKPNSIFFHYLAAPYGPRMYSPTGLAKYAGKDDAQTYLRTHDLGTGPYTLTDAKVGSHYEMKAYEKYWGKKPYFTTVDLPVLGDIATQQLKFDKGELAAILHDLPRSAAQAYLKNKSIKAYPSSIMSSTYVYLNMYNSFLTTQANRMAVQQAIDTDTIFSQVWEGRAKQATQAYPGNMIADGLAAQKVEHTTAPLAKLVQSLPADQKQLTVGYTSGTSDSQLVANLISAQLGALGLQVKVQPYPTSQVFGWIDDLKGSPDMYIGGGWPDAASPYMWAKISWDKTGGLNYLQCDVPEITKLLPEGLETGDDQIFSKIGELAVESGCYQNLVYETDFQVAQPWLKGVKKAHVITEPNTIRVSDLSVG